MDQYEYIRIAHRVYGKSIRQIQRETGHDRKTIRKVLRSEPFEYSRRAGQTYPALGKYLEVIDQWLEEDKDQPKKQRHTARRIYHRLVQENGFKGSESAVRHYVRGAKIRLGVGVSRAFIPLDPECGKEAEVDWGRAVAIICGVRTPVHFFSMRSRHSGKHFVRSYLCERQQAFFDAHIHAFDFFGGIFPTVVYDNLTAAIKRVLTGRARIEQEGFRRFHAFYNFTPRFCNPDCAHEKGGIEGMIGYVRRNYMVPIPRVEGLEELNNKLFEMCVSYGDHRIDGREGSINDLFEGERAHLIPLPPSPFSTIQTTQGKVNHYSTVIVDKNRYSVPTRYVGLKVNINFDIDRIEIFYNGKTIATHRRVFGNNKWQLDAQHYLEIIQKKPQAFHAARPIRQWRQAWPKALEELLIRFEQTQGQTAGIKDFISVLMLYKDHPAVDVQASIELALERGISTSHGVRHILLHSHSDYPVEPLKGWRGTSIPDLTVYGRLGGVQ